MSKDQKPDKENNVGASISAPNARWTFGGGVAGYFDSHVKRSIPFYQDGHDLILKISDFFINNESLVYDLGCSTASLTKQLAIRSAGKSVRIVGVDSEPEMVKRAQKECLNFSNIVIQQTDIVDFEFEPSDLIISCYTIQFVHPRYRQQLFNEIYKALNWGGGFL
jgi:tRNA (cmo5U34)-methyltransferase